MTELLTIFWMPIILTIVALVLTLAAVIVLFRLVRWFLSQDFFDCDFPVHDDDDDYDYDDDDYDDD